MEERATLTRRTEPSNEELRDFVDAMLSNLDKVFRELEVIDEAIDADREMWEMLYRAARDAEALEPPPFA